MGLTHFTSSGLSGGRCAQICEIQSLEQRLLFGAGDLDTTFGQKGMVWLYGSDANAPSNCVAVQRDGKVLVTAGYRPLVAHSTLTRYKTDGKKDLSFGVQGRVIVSRPQTLGDGGLLIQSDGKILTGHHAADGTWNLVRYTPDGKLDAKFGKKGATVGGDDMIYGLTTSGKYIYAIRYVSGFQVERYLMNGKLDAAFGGSGIVHTTFAFDSGSKSYCQGVAVQGDGKVVVAGNANEHFALARYNLDGSLDPTFGGTGQVVTDLPASSEAITRIHIQKDGKILAVGRNAGNYGYTTAFARYMPDGSLDTSFGTNGSVDTDVYSAAVSTLQGNGKFVLAGEANGRPLVARYNPDGALDKSFGKGGKVAAKVGGAGDKRFVFSQGRDGDVVLVTRTRKAGKNWLVLVRYQGK